MTEEERNEFYKFISNDLNPPLGCLHLSLEGRVNFKALMFVPETPPLRFLREEDLSSLHLYSSKVFIRDDCKELLPEYLRFISGVVDTEDLPLNVSREVTQASPVMARIRETLTGRTLSLLEDWAKMTQRSTRNSSGISVCSSKQDSVRISSTEIDCSTSCGLNRPRPKAASLPR